MFGLGDGECLLELYKKWCWVQGGKWGQYLFLKLTSSEYALLGDVQKVILPNSIGNDCLVAFCLEHGLGSIRGILVSQEPFEGQD